MITKTEVERIASLACIQLDDEELSQFTIQLNSILEYFDELAEIETDLEEERQDNVVRPDDVTKSLTQEEALANAPRVENGYFRGPRIL